MFVGREKEIKEIKEALGSNHFEAILVYGRRRVGKTETIKQAIKDSSLKVFAYECQKTSLETNVKKLGNVINDFLGIKGVEYASFETALDALFRFSLERGLVVVIDEFSFLLEKDPSLESAIAVLIDQYKERSKMKLVLSGSYVNLMKHMVEGGAHSYGRFSHILPIRPFDYYQSSLFYPDWSEEDKLIAYSAFGGVAYFNSLIDPNKPVLENIKGLILKRDSILEHEIQEMLLSETKKIDFLNDIIALLGRGVDKYSDIVSILSQEKAARPKYLLDKLIDMDLIEVRYPLNEKNNKKQQRYFFKDNLLHFYFRFVFNSNYVFLRENADFFFDKFVKEPLFHEYLPRMFEVVAKQFLVKKNLLGQINPPFYEIGEYVYHDKKQRKNRQFDLVSIDENGFISYECKFTKEPIHNADIKEEIIQTKDLDGISFYRLGFISKNGFAENIEKADHIFFTLKDFYQFS